MPMYEYRCQKCDQDFSLKMTMAEHDKKEISCPLCNEKGPTPNYGTFFAKTSRKS